MGSEMCIRDSRHTDQQQQRRRRRDSRIVPADHPGLPQAGQPQGRTDQDEGPADLPGHLVTETLQGISSRNGTARGPGTRRPGSGQRDQVAWWRGTAEPSQPFGTLLDHLAQPRGALRPGTLERQDHAIQETRDRSEGEVREANRDNRRDEGGGGRHRREERTGRAVGS